jgi:hypothetical protein
MLDNQIKFVREQVSSIIQARQQWITIGHEHESCANNSMIIIDDDTSSTNISSLITKSTNRFNDHVFRVLSRESAFRDFLTELISIYGYDTQRTIQCVAVIFDENARRTYLFIQSLDGSADTYEMNASKSLKDTYAKMTEPTSLWNDADKHLQYYQRFTHINVNNGILATDQLTQIKSKNRRYTHRDRFNYLICIFIVSLIDILI